MNLYSGNWLPDGGLVEHEVARVDAPTLTRLLRDQPTPDPTAIILTPGPRMLAITIDADRVLLSYQREPGASHFLLGDPTAPGDVPTIVGGQSVLWPRRSLVTRTPALELLHTHSINTTPPHLELNP